MFPCCVGNDVINRISRDSKLLRERFSSLAVPVTDTNRTDLFVIQFRMTDSLAHGMPAVTKFITAVFCGCSPRQIVRTVVQGIAVEMAAAF